MDTDFQSYINALKSSFNSLNFRNKTPTDLGINNIDLEKLNDYINKKISNINENIVLMLNQIQKNVRYIIANKENTNSSLPELRTKIKENIGKIKDLFKNLISKIDFISDYIKNYSENNPRARFNKLFNDFKIEYSKIEPSVKGFIKSIESSLKVHEQLYEKFKIIISLPEGKQTKDDETKELEKKYEIYFPTSLSNPTVYGRWIEFIMKCINETKSKFWIDNIAIIDTIHDFKSHFEADVILNNFITFYKSNGSIYSGKQDESLNKELYDILQEFIKNKVTGVTIENNIKENLQTYFGLNEENIKKSRCTVLKTTLDDKKSILFKKFIYKEDNGIPKIKKRIYNYKSNLSDFFKNGNLTDKYFYVDFFNSKTEIKPFKKIKDSDIQKMYSETITRLLDPGHGFGETTEKDSKDDSKDDSQNDSKDDSQKIRRLIGSYNLEFPCMSFLLKIQNKIFREKYKNFCNFIEAISSEGKTGFSIQISSEIFKSFSSKINSTSITNLFQKIKTNFINNNSYITLNFENHVDNKFPIKTLIILQEELYNEVELINALHDSFENIYKKISQYPEIVTIQKELLDELKELKIDFGMISEDKKILQKSNCEIYTDKNGNQTIIKKKQSFSIQELVYLYDEYTSNFPNFTKTNLLKIFTYDMKRLGDWGQIYQSFKDGIIFIEDDMLASYKGILDVIAYYNSPTKDICFGDLYEIFKSKQEMGEPYLGYILSTQERQLKDDEIDQIPGMRQEIEDSKKNKFNLQTIKYFKTGVYLNAIDYLCSAYVSPLLKEDSKKQEIITKPENFYTYFNDSLGKDKPKTTKVEKIETKSILQSPATTDIIDPIQIDNWKYIYSPASPYANLSFGNNNLNLEKEYFYSLTPIEKLILKKEYTNIEKAFHSWLFEILNKLSCIKLNEDAKNTIKFMFRDKNRFNIELKKIFLQTFKPKNINVKFSEIKSILELKSNFGTQKRKNIDSQSIDNASKKQRKNGVDNVVEEDEVVEDEEVFDVIMDETEAEIQLYILFIIYEELFYLLHHRWYKNKHISTRYSEKNIDFYDFIFTCIYKVLIDKITEENIKKIVKDKFDFYGCYISLKKTKELFGCPESKKIKPNEENVSLNKLSSKQIEENLPSIDKEKLILLIQNNKVKLSETDGFLIKKLFFNDKQIDYKLSEDLYNIDFVLTNSKREMEQKEVKRYDISYEDKMKYLELSPYDKTKNINQKEDILLPYKINFLFDIMNEKDKKLFLTIKHFGLDINNIDLVMKNGEETPLDISENIKSVISIYPYI